MIVKEFLSKRKLNIICSAAAILFMWLVWIIAFYAVGNEYIIPSFTATFVSLGRCFAEGSFWIAFLNTLLRTALAAVISFALAAALAVGSVLSKAFYAFVKPFMAFFRTLPTLAVILVLLVWTSPKIAPIIVTALVLFPIMYSQLTAAAFGIDQGLLEMAEVYRLPKKVKLFKIYLPLVSPNILSQTGPNVSLGIKIMISAEVLANTYKSLGGLMQEARLYVEMPRLAALTLAAVAAGFIFDIALSQLERITFKWSRKE